MVSQKENKTTSVQQLIANSRNQKNEENSGKSNASSIIFCSPYLYFDDIWHCFHPYF